MKFMNKSGVTLVALIITIIVMIIIAGVSISLIVGDNNTIDKAQEAKLSEEQRSKKELLEQALIKYNNGDYVGNYSDLREFLIAELGIDEYYTNEENEQKKNIAEFKDLDGEMAYVIHDFQGEAVYLKTEDEFWEIENFSDLGHIAKLEDGDVLISPKNDEELEIDGDKFAIINNANDLKDISFNIPANKTVSIKLLSDMTITNEGLKRSAINLNSNSTLNLQVEANVTVNSTLGEDANGSVAGKGGYAGIRVPANGTLNLSGKGTITCYGGDAGDGGTSTGKKDQKCAGGGGAGAGIGGNGGTGGAFKNGKGENGGNGESCGTVNITGELSVYAYGGAGGSGGPGTIDTATAGGAGGYPAAGIGGGGAGGAGGTCCAGAGGYSGGSGEKDTRKMENGLAGGNGQSQKHYIGGGGYFQGGYGTDINGIDRAITCFGGIANQGWHDYKTHGTGFGGTAGSGGTIVVSSTAKIYAYNGNLYSDGTSYNNGANQCPIYLQAGINTAKYDYISQGNNVSYTKFKLKLLSAQSSLNTLSYKNPAGGGKLNINSKLGISNNPLNSVDMSKQGIGSGAGYKEISNGSYTRK